MVNFHHKAIKRFTLDGTIHDDSAIARLRNEYSRLIQAEMKFSGYAQRLDIAEDFTIRYNETRQVFEFKLSMYGIYVGKKQSEWILGIDGNTVIYTHENKFKESLQEQGSKSNQK